MFSAKYHHPSQTVGTKCLILVTERVFCSLRIVSLVHFPTKFLETSVKKSPWIKEIIWMWVKMEDRCGTTDVNV